MGEWGSEWPPELYYRMIRQQQQQWGGSGGGVGFLPQSLAIFAAFTTPPSSARRNAIDTLVRTLVTAGIWFKLDLLYDLGAADSQAARINWITPGAFTITAVNSPTFAADQGYTGNGTDNYLDSGFNPSLEASPKYTQDSACMFGRLRVAGTGGAFGQSTGTMFAPDFPLVRANQNVGFGPAGMNVAAFWSINRSGAASATVYKNGTSHATDSEASVPLGNANALALRAAGIFGTHQLSSWGMGQSLNAGEQLLLAAAEAAYQASK